MFAVLGLYPISRKSPFTPGFEISGIVHAVGSNVHTYQVGDRVCGLSRFGGYATILNLHQDYVYPMESGWSFEEAAAYPCQALTAWYALCILGGLNKGACRILTSPDKRVLIHSAAGGVGLMLIDLIRYIGGDVIATVGHEDKIPILRQRGVPRNRIIVRGRDDAAGFEEAVRRRLGTYNEGYRQNGCVDLVIDPVMGRYFNEGWRLLNRGGRYVVMGKASLMPTRTPNKKLVRALFSSLWRRIRRPKADVLASINQYRSVATFNMGDMFDSSDIIQQGFEELSQMGLERPFIARSFAFNDVHEALHTLRTGQVLGRAVLLVGQEEPRYRYQT